LKGDIKREFIKEYCRSRIVSETSLNGVLNKISAIERAKKKDIILFSVDEIIAIEEKKNEP
jgi:hypothetical protein